MRLCLEGAQRLDFAGCLGLAPHSLGVIWIRPDDVKRGLHVVVDQLATLKADHNFLIADESFALAA